MILGKETKAFRKRAKYTGQATLKNSNVRLLNRREKSRTGIEKAGDCGFKMISSGIQVILEKGARGGGKGCLSRCN